MSYLTAQTHLLIFLSRSLSYSLLSQPSHLSTSLPPFSHLSHVPPILTSLSYSLSLPPSLSHSLSLSLWLALGQLQVLHFSPTVSGCVEACAGPFENVSVRVSGGVGPPSRAIKPAVTLRRANGDRQATP